jgi:hypothetical protein
MENTPPAKPTAPLRDAHGRFIKKDGTSSPHTNPLEHLAKVSKSPLKHSEDDTLVDVHVNNPLKKITQLLEEIKKQKAFAFTIKGSLGIAGIALVLTTFGILGGTKAFCSKGNQTHLGFIRPLLLTQNASQNPWLTRLQNFWQFLNGQEVISGKKTPQFILVETTGTIYHLLDLPAQLNLARETSYLVTGNLDSCSQTITVSSPQAVEPY